MHFFFVRYFQFQFIAIGTSPLHTGDILFYQFHLDEGGKPSSEVRIARKLCNILYFFSVLPNIAYPLLTRKNFMTVLLILTY